MPDYKVHLVGSIPFSNATEVFERVGRQLGPSLERLPDGETGDRSEWLGWIDQIFDGHPDFVPTKETYQAHQADRVVTKRYRVRDGVDPKAVTFDDLPHAGTALASYADFARQKKFGVIPNDVRFMLTFATPISVAGRYVVAEEQDAIEAAYTKSLFGEIAKVAAKVPHDQLAVQWDVASAVFRSLQNRLPNRYGATRDEQISSYAAAAVEMGHAVPADIELVYHFCYGSAGNRHTVEPIDMQDMVDMANRICATIKRPVQLIHMPVPQNRDDDAYFAPLKNLKLRPETKLALGLLNFNDGVEGARRRIATAKRHVTDFAIGSECGFGRYPRDKVPEILDLHARIAGVA